MITPKDIQIIVLKNSGLSSIDFNEKTKQRDIVYGRYVYYYICKKLINISFPKIGKSLDLKQSHCTVMHGISQIEQILSSRHSSYGKLIEVILSSLAEAKDLDDYLKKYEKPENKPTLDYLAEMRDKIDSIKIYYTDLLEKKDLEIKRYRLLLGNNQDVKDIMALNPGDIMEWRQRNAAFLKMKTTINKDNQRYASKRGI